MRSTATRWPSSNGRVCSDPCFCTRAEIREAASAPHGELPEGAYPGTCRELSPSGRRRRAAEGRQFALRVRSGGEYIEFAHIILMDEPFGALDPLTRLNMQDLLIGLWREQEATVFFVTHSVEEAVFLGDRIFVLTGTPGTIVKDMELPTPDRPAREMQREASFSQTVFAIRDIVESAGVSK